jgi:hypothetical protein
LRRSVIAPAAGAPPAIITAERNHRPCGAITAEKASAMESAGHSIGRTFMSNRTRWRALVQVAAFAALLCAGAARGADRDYRLAGIVSVGTDRLIAVIEMPDGRQGLFREGDALGDGRIRDVTRAGVRVQLEGGDVLLTLRGNPRLSGAVPVADTDDMGGDYSPDGPEGDPSVRTQPLFYQDTVELLTSAALATLDASTGLGDKGLPPEIGTEILASRLNEVLGVPVGARIVGVDRDPVTTPQEVIDAVVPRLNDGSAVRLSLSEAGDIEAIYITPVDEQAPPGQ